jgi:hypothetical protein
MEGIETHWRNATGTNVKTQPINPIGDFDLDKYSEG